MVLREQIGVDPSNPSVVLNLAAIGITNGTWGFVEIFERLADPVRVLPDGRTLRHLAGEDLDELVAHMDRALGGIAASAERHGLDLRCCVLPLTAG
jgi:hypothetical protein